MRDRKVIPYTYSEKIYVYDLNGLDMSDITYESDVYKVSLTHTCIRIFTHIRKYYELVELNRIKMKYIILEYSNILILNKDFLIKNIN